jgi:hypothetical protein
MTSPAGPRPTPIIELGMAEAYELLETHFGLTEMPPLDAIENEDWGRDWLLSQFFDLAPEVLASAGLSLEDDPTGS